MRRRGRRTMSWGRPWNRPPTNPGKQPPQVKVGIKVNWVHVLGRSQSVNSGDAAGEARATCVAAPCPRRHPPPCLRQAAWLSIPASHTPPPFNPPPSPVRAALVRKADFVSVSAYAPINSRNPKPNDLQRNLQNVQDELRRYGASIK